MDEKRLRNGRHTRLEQGPFLEWRFAGVQQRRESGRPARLCLGREEQQEQQLQQWRLQL